MEKGDPVHFYLLLDFLSLLFTTLLSDNPEGQLDRFARRFERSRRQKEEEEEEEARAGPPTSGAEEVDRILTEARRRYGRIRPAGFRENIDAQNISSIAKPKEGPTATAAVSQVDNKSIPKAVFRVPQPPVVGGKRQPSSSEGKKIGGLHRHRRSHPGVSSSSSAAQEESTTSSVSCEHVVTSSSARSGSSAVGEEEEEEEVVNVRIPLEEASINLRIRSRDRDRPISGRRIHVRVRGVFTI